MEISQAVIFCIVREVSNTVTVILSVQLIPFIILSTKYVVVCVGLTEILEVVLPKSLKTISF